MKEMTVESVRINLQTSQRVAILKATKQERYVFIWIAHAEAYAIAIELQGTKSPRPLTHDLFINLMSACEMNVVSCVISDLVDEIMTTALMDRLTHKAHILEFIGESFRFRQRIHMGEQVTSVETG